VASGKGVKSICAGDGGDTDHCGVCYRITEAAAGGDEDDHTFQGCADYRLF